MATQDIISKTVSEELLRNEEVFSKEDGHLGVTIDEIINDCQNAVEDEFNNQGLGYDYDNAVKAEVKKQLDWRHVVIRERRGNRTALGWFTNLQDAESFMELIKSEHYHTTIM